MLILPHLIDLGADTISFFTAAREVIGDGLGNDNGLCEAGETCILARNRGSYQGHGSLMPSTCPVTTAADGIAGVTFLESQTNGY